MQPCVVADGEKVRVNKMIIPFSCGTQYMDWSESNCNRCTKGVHHLNDDAAWPTCELEVALLTACFGDGAIDERTAQRIGVTDQTEGHYTWPCGEVDWTEEWKAEWYRLHPERQPVTA